MENKYSRREFLRRAGIVGASTYGFLLAGDELLDILEEAKAAGQPTLSIASKGSPERLVKKAIDGLGGIGKFVKKGSKVLIKPNLAWIRTPETAANTNPQVLAGIIKLCKAAGASSIIVFDHTCDNGPAAFKANGAAKVASDLGVQLISGHSRSLYKKINIPKGKILKSDECAKFILEADCFINVPIAKVHGSTGITASLKNMMGANWNRQAWHQNGLNQCIADYFTAVKPDLIILDAVRILLTRGPKGPGETKDVGQVIASTDPVAIDAYAATLLGKEPSSIGHITAAAAHGLGQINLKKVTIKRV
ncbi:MAG: DUF362 domain-containing protein [Armatimonadota bacterium]|nr:DUF362 domain-containing protein [Armatimonadota bacterium]